MWVGSATDTFSERRVKDRIRFISVMFAIGCGILLLRLFYLQVMKGDDFALVSESNRTHTIFLSAPRGNFYDYQWKKLITNRPSWSLMYSVPQDSIVSEESVSSRLKPFLDPFPSRWEKRLSRAFKTKQLVRLIEDVPSPIAFGMREMGELLPGLRMEMEFRRDYPNGSLSPQLLGYLGEIDEKELKNHVWFSRKPGDLIGKMGLERILDSNLRGQDGGMLIEVDSFGRLKKVLRELPYEEGSSVQVTLDVDIQRVAQEGLAQTRTKRGAAVVLDVQTGAIRAWVSSPLFDASFSLAEEVINPNLPFFDRVYKGAYPPGSVYKIMTAIAGFESGAIRMKEKVNCVGFVTLRDRRVRERKYRCWRKHGRVDFWRAISESCDTYFYLLAKKMGAVPIYETSVDFGFGAPVQTDLPNENRGNIPNPTWKRKKGLGGWATGDTLNMSIGQGYVTSTPLQVAVMMAGVVARGEIKKPYIINRVLDETGDVIFQAKPTLLKEVKLKEATWDKILFGTRLVITKGTGRVCHIPYLEVRGKTGTAQNPHGKDHAWFVASAGYPKEEPRYAVCVFVENGGNGGSVAAPIARRILETALPRRQEDSI